MDSEEYDEDEDEARHRKKRKKESRYGGFIIDEAEVSIINGLLYTTVPFLRCLTLQHHFLKF